MAGETENMPPQDFGKDGSKLKRIGTESRKKIEHRLDTKVFLKLLVRVQKSWRKDTRALRKFGY